MCIVREQPEIPVYLVPISSLPIPDQLDKPKQSEREATAEVQERDLDPEPEDPGDSDDEDESIVFDAWPVPMPPHAPVPAPRYSLRKSVPDALPDASSDQFQGEDPAASPDTSQAGDSETETESDIPTILSGEYNLDESPVGSDIVDEIVKLTTQGCDVQAVV